MPFRMLTLDRRLSELAADIEGLIVAGEIRNTDQLENAKISLSKKHGTMRLMRNAEIIQQLEMMKRPVPSLLMTKPVRTASGVANIAVMWKGPELGEGKFFSCPASCIYCPQGENSPKAYTGIEPTTMRAKRHDYDPFAQVQARLGQLHVIGHSTDKCELIIMGGTFPAMPFQFQQNFVKGCFGAFNGCASPSLQEAHEMNETAKNRCVGLTIETRADYCEPEKLLSLGCTRVEIGVQSTDDEILSAIGRGHDAAANIAAIKRIKDAGLKFTAHWMPGLTGLFGDVDTDKEIAGFQKLFTADYQPDELKIYPTLVIEGTRLHELWKKNEYAPLTEEQMLRLLVRMKEIVPGHIRIKRVMRDISEHKAEAGARKTNLRQLAKELMERQGLSCRCIRCREIKSEDVSDDNLVFSEKEYAASEGREIFIQCISDERLLGFLRLRLSERAMVRELHVYGRMLPVGVTDGKAAQHRGIGKALLNIAEQKAAAEGYKEIFVTSGVGVRSYYKKLCYELKNSYMAKVL